MSVMVGIGRGAQGLGIRLADVLGQDLDALDLDDGISGGRASGGELTLEVYTDNRQAMAFYKRLGFQEISRRPVDDDGNAFENARLRLIG